MAQAWKYLLGVWVLIFLVVSCGTPIIVISGEWSAQQVKPEGTRAAAPDPIKFSGSTVDFYVAGKIVRSGSIKTVTVDGVRKNQIVGDGILMDISDINKNTMTLSGEIDGVVTEYKLTRK